MTVSLPNTLKKHLQQNKVVLFIGPNFPLYYKYKNGNPVFYGYHNLINIYGARTKNVSKSNTEEKKNKIKFEEFLKKELTPDLDKINQESLKFIDFLLSINFPIIITTNYDNILYWRHPDKKNLVVGNYFSVVEMLDNFDSLNKNVIWHLYGNINQQINLFSEDGCVKEYHIKDDSTKYLIEKSFNLLQKMLDNFIFLFIGYDLKHPFLTKYLHKMLANSKNEHYLLMENNQIEQITTNYFPLKPVTFSKFEQFYEQITLSLDNRNKNESKKTISKIENAEYDQKETAIKSLPWLVIVIITIISSYNLFVNLSILLNLAFIAVSILIPVLLVALQKIKPDIFYKKEKNYFNKYFTAICFSCIGLLLFSIVVLTYQISNLEKIKIETLVPPSNINNLPATNLPVLDQKSSSNTIVKKNLTNKSKSSVNKSISNRTPAIKIKKAPQKISTKSVQLLYNKNYYCKALKECERIIKQNPKNIDEFIKLKSKILQTIKILKRPPC